MPAAEPKIELREVSLALDGKAVLEQLSLHIPADGVTCDRALRRGKTTLLRLIAGLIRPDAGEITGVPDRPSFLFQEDRLIPWLTARGNVRAVLPPSGGAQADRLLREVGLDADADSYPDALSGGMRRRVALARALAYGGGILLLDEPFKGLDPELMERLGSADSAPEPARARIQPRGAGNGAARRQDASVLRARRSRCWNDR